MTQLFRSRQVAAGVVVSLVTLAVVGLLLVAYTPVGCGPAKALGLKSVSKRCIVTQTVAGRPTPSPSPESILTPSPASPPYVPPASPPYYPPVSQPYPPFNPDSSRRARPSRRSTPQAAVPAQRPRHSS